MGLSELIKKYSKPGPRYTSYPTAPQWTDKVNHEALVTKLKQESESSSDPLALYVHIPFCEKLCYYCGCNIQITRDKTRSQKYLESVFRELEKQASYLGRKTLRQMSWGGGTPTFLTVEEIEKLYKKIQAHFDFAPDAEISVEIHPKVTTFEQLAKMKELGFTRVSLGVQDFDVEVQKVIHRFQSVENTAEVLNECRRLGYTGINFDMIYGLPLQTVESFSKSVDILLDLVPDRIALYNYARLPDMIAHQKLLEKYPMPNAEERVEIFIQAYDKLTRRGYRAIGMDHFALPDDELSKAIDQGTLYRNFMGYVSKKTGTLLAIGASSIAEFSDGFFQNIRAASEYEAIVDKTGLATMRGFLLSPEDRERKWLIQNVFCAFEVNEDKFFDTFKKPLATHYAEELSQLPAFEEDGILEKTPFGWRVTELGRLFVRNVAMVFDEYLKQASGFKKYSQTV